ncbi:hypothetical protein BU23DRAFT_550349 [Bimuria novae-zelandiae CBS 107.79]|uniref:Uncharacterized protein n=1 Tax=Bimuria novae-zelandiae CBS 107.79 TaxID=1447943 RepID=A0A6A5VLU3_9PLEO|nr:hypothetical protein BU23DRAFT_550349 [Bimuria novae-zelandiae CBS 107.79]
MTTVPAGDMRAQSTSTLPGRPLTPPDFDSDCFSDGHSHARSSTSSTDRDRGSLPSEPAEATRRPKLASSVTEPAYANAVFRPVHNESAFEHGVESYPQAPMTPVRTPWSSGLLPKESIPHYPYTPDSIRSTKSHGIRPLSPLLPSMPWNTRNLCSSPMQDALLSCAMQLENLIQTREPTDEQMEYLVSKFEEMARFLSAPDAQSRQTDDHLFSEVEGPADATGLGIVSEETTSHHLDAHDLAMSQGYVLEVGRYIESVKTHVQDLAMRMDEVKQLNSIQLDIISDLRRELKNKSSQPKQDERSSETEEIIEKIPSQKISFWSAIGEALDTMGEMLHEW